MTNIIIGSLIEDEVRKQQIAISEFASQIGCERANVYKIFKSNRISIVQLKRISKVLSHNFFEDLAKDMELANPVIISKEEEEKQRVIGQFMEVVPRVLQKLGIDANIVIGTKRPDELNQPLPDYILSDFNISFTVGQTFEELCNGFYQNGLTFFKPTPGCPAKMVQFVNNVDGLQYLDIAIDYKTEEEWEQTIRYAMEEIQSSYLPHTWYYLETIRNTNK